MGGWVRGEGRAPDASPCRPAAAPLLPGGSLSRAHPSFYQCGADDAYNPIGTPTRLETDWKFRFQSASTPCTKARDARPRSRTALQTDAPRQNLPWISAVGNHDIPTPGGVDTQINYGDSDAKWVLVRQRRQKSGLRLHIFYPFFVAALAIALLFHGHHRGRRQRARNHVEHEPLHREGGKGADEQLFHLSLLILSPLLAVSVNEEPSLWPLPGAGADGQLWPPLHRRSGWFGRRFCVTEPQNYCPVLNRRSDCLAQPFAHFI